MQNVHITYTVEKSIEGAWFYHSEASTKINKLKKRNRCKRKADFTQYLELYDDYEALSDFEENFDDEYELYEQQRFMNNVDMDEELIDAKQLLVPVKQASVDHVDVDYDFCDDFLPQSPDLKEDYVMADFMLDSSTDKNNTDRWVFPMDVAVSDGSSTSMGDSFQCVVQIDDLREEILIEAFGRRYTEAKCSQRRIVIFGENFLDTGSYVVLQILSKDMHYSNIKVTCKHKQKRLFENLDINKAGAVDIIAFVHSFFKHLSKTDHSKVVQIKDSMRRDKEWPSQTYFLKYFKPLAEMVSENEVWYLAVCNQKAGNCLEELLDFNECAVCALSNELLYTTQCYHSLCYNCWDEYIKNKVSGLTGSVICPEDGCQQSLDPVLVTSHLETNEAMVYAQKYTELHITQSEGLKRCPFENCLEIACYHEPIAKGEHVPLIAKHHSSEIIYTHSCFLCEANEHWPASCQSVKQYESERSYTENNYLSTGAPVKECIFYKLCPSCNYPIEKDGGCNYMTCFCGVKFCWKCLTELKTIEDESHFCRNKPGRRLALLSLDNCRDDVKIRLIFKAIATDKHIELARFKNNVSIFSNHPNYNTLRRAYYLYLDCYSFLRNLYIQTAFTESRHLRSRVVKYAERLVNALNKLNGTTFFSLDTNVKFLHVGYIIKHVAVIESVLDEMDAIGIKKRPVCEK